MKLDVTFIYFLLICSFTHPTMILQQIKSLAEKVIIMQVICTARICKTKRIWVLQYICDCSFCL